MPLFSVTMENKRVVVVVGVMANSVEDAKKKAEPHSPMGAFSVKVVEWKEEIFAAKVPIPTHAKCPKCENEFELK